MNQLVVPAIIPESFGYLEDIVRKLSGVHALQIDLVDNSFAQSVSWPYIHEAGQLPTETHQSLRQICHSHSVDVDLMVADPLAAAKVWLALGAELITVHVESLQKIEDFLQLKHQYNYQLGLSLNNDTDLASVLAYASVLDYVQCMGIAQIGSQGQPFDERVLERVVEIKSEYPALLVSVDGSVNADTIPRLKAAGVGRFVVGSAIVKQPDPAAAHRQLTELAAGL